MIPQSGFDFSRSSNNNNNFSIKNLLAIKDSGYAIKLVDDIVHLIYNMSRARNKIDRIVAINMFVKMRFNCSTIDVIVNVATNSYKISEKLVEYFNYLFDDTVQSLDDQFAAMRDILDKYAMLKHTAFYKKIYRFIMYMLSLCIFDKYGVSVDKMYSKVEAEAIKEKYHLGPDFIHCVLDTILFLCQRGYQCFKLGRIEPIFHCANTYETWFEEAEQLKALSFHTGNLKAHGLSKFEFLGRLNVAIEKGDAMRRFAFEIDVVTKRILSKTLSELKKIKADEITRKAALSNRKSPFAILVHGGSSVMKSSFANLLFYHYGKVMKLPIEDHYRYVRNPVDEYWSNFESSKWCIQMDDIAFVNPDKCPDIDPTLKEMIQVVNNVPFVPAQADLSDKGKTPVNCSLVIATTNVHHLNDILYFNCPLAVRRRFPFVISINIKEEYRAENSPMVDPRKVPEIVDGEYPNVWNIEVNKIVFATQVEDMQYAKRQLVDTFNDIYEFLDWYISVAKEHDIHQARGNDANDIMQRVTLCSVCNRPESRCICQVQSGMVSEEEAIPYWWKLLYNCKQYICSRREIEMDETANDTTSFVNFDNFYDLWINNYTFIQCEKLSVISFVMLLAYTMYNGGLSGFFRNVGAIWATCIVYLYYCITPINFLLIWIFGTNFIVELVTKRMPKVWQRYVFRLIGRRIETRIGRIRGITKLALMICSVYIVVKGYAKIIKNWGNNDEVQVGDEEKDIKKEIKIGRPPKPDKIVKEDFWHNQPYVLSTFDVSSRNISWKNLKREELIKHLATNCVTFKFEMRDGVFKRTKAVCVVGHLYVFNLHAIEDLENKEYIYFYVMSNDFNNVCPDVRVKCHHSEFIKDKEKDLAFVDIRALPPKKKLIDLFVKESNYGSFNGFYIQNGEDGINVREVKNIERKLVSNRYLNTNCDSFTAIVSIPTCSGDCGTLMVAESAFGPILLGLHYLGHGTKVSCVSLTFEYLTQMLEKFDPQIQCGTPMLSSELKKRELGPLNRKSFLNHISGVGRVFGSFKDFRSRPKSLVKKTIIHESMRRHGFECKYGVPPLGGWEPWYNAGKELVNPVTEISLYEVKKALNSLLVKLDKAKLDYSYIHVYDRKTGINGYPGVAYVDKLNRNTSAGNPWKTSKRYLIEDDKDEVYPEGVTFHKDVLDRIDEMILRYSEGETCMVNFGSALKDEPLSEAKMKINKIRVFIPIPLDASILTRQFFLPMIKFIRHNRLFFGFMPGLVVQSLDYDAFYKKMTKHGKENMIEGDHELFDKRVPAVVTITAFKFLILIAERAGYNKEHCLIMHAMSEDACYPLVELYGDLIQLFCSLVSGHNLTVDINDLINSFYMRICYMALHPNQDILSFNEYVEEGYFGDDLLLNVANEVKPFFSHTTIQRQMKKFGLNFTMSDKNAPSIPFLHINEVTFLKRKFKLHDELRVIVGPLDITSINKMLMITVQSKTITPEKQICEIINSALQECFWHGRDMFNEYKDMLLGMVKEHELEIYCSDSTFMTYESLINQFWNNSKHYCGTDYITSQGVPLEQVHDFSESKPKVHIADSDCFTNMKPQSEENGSVYKSSQGRSPKLLFSKDQQRVKSVSKRRCGSGNPFGLHRKPTYNNINNNNCHTSGKKRAFSSVEHTSCKIDESLVQFRDYHEILMHKYPALHGPRCATCRTFLRVEVEMLYIALFGRPKSIKFLAKCESMDCVLLTNSHEIMEDLKCIPRIIKPISYCLSCVVEVDLIIRKWCELMGVRIAVSKTFCYSTISSYSDEHCCVFSEYDDLKLDSIAEGEYNQEDMEVEEGLHNMSVHSTGKWILNEERKFERDYPQSGLEETDNIAQTDTTQEQMGFVDIGKGDQHEEVDNIYGLDKTSSLDVALLGEYLSRPTLIISYPMNLTDVAFTHSTYYPWHLYFNTTAIKNKLHNFPFLRCKLHLKFVLNASPFYYGYYLASYRPLSGYWTDTVVTDTSGTEITPYSQRPHIWLKPQTNTGGELTLPFFHHKDYMDLTAADLQSMGQLTISPVDVLKSANAASGSGTQVEVQVFAWATDITMCGLTGALAVQSGDEYSANGPASRMASAIATAAGYLEDVPVIGKFATATRIGSTAIGRIASMFGFTNTPNITSSQGMYPAPFPNMASTDINIPIEKLAIDSKNELTIDPRSVGLENIDEMSINYICSKESYLTSFPISYNALPGATLFTATVTPAYYRESSLPKLHFQHVPMSYVAHAFKYWKGDIIYRFVVVATKFHKGRIRITYEPIQNISVSGVPDYSTNFTKIVDISESTDFEVVVPYTQNYPWLTVQDAPTIANQFPYYGNGLASVNRTPGTDNGQICISLITSLSAPVSNASINVQVFVKGGDNLEFGMPNQVDQTYSYFIPQAEDYIEKNYDDMIAGSKSNVKNSGRFLMNHGEHVTSIRQLLHRFCYQHSLAVDASAGAQTNNTYTISVMGIWPIYYGFDPKAYTIGNKAISGTAPFTFASNSFYSWFTPMYIGMRGSSNWRFVADQTAIAQPIYTSKLSRTDTPNGSASWVLYNWLTDSLTLSKNNTCRWWSIIMNDDESGCAITNQLTQSGLGANFPFYSQYKFHFTDPTKRALNVTTNDDSSFYSMKYINTVNGTSTNLKYHHVDKYYSTGPDFQLFFWINVPTVYVQAQPSGP